METAGKCGSDFVRIRKLNNEQRVVYGEVYAPSVVDTHGEFMAAEDVESMAHRFMQLATIQRSIDTEHNNIPNGCYPIESFIARKGDPDYTEGAWVLGVKIEDDQIWEAVKSGRIGGYSFQALVRKKPVVIEVDVDPTFLGVTEEVEGHKHIFFLEFDDEGRVTSGITSNDNGHSHVIRRGTTTEERDGHKHRIMI